MFWRKRIARDLLRRSQLRLTSQQRRVEFKVSSVNVEVVIPFDVSVHEVRFKVVFDFSVLALSRLHVGCPHQIDYATEFGGIVER